MEERKADGAAAAAELSAVRAQLEAAQAAACDAKTVVTALRSELDSAVADSREQRRVYSEMQVRFRRREHVHRGWQEILVLEMLLSCIAIDLMW